MNFDDEFAAAGAGPALLYRTKGMQIVPAYIPGEQPKGQSWKRPRLKEWVEYQEALIPDALFNSWYGPGGQFVSRENMGMICGRASDNLFVIDLDLYKNLGAAAWWHGLMEVHNNGFELETVEQITGGGGRQKIFRAPRGWMVPNKAIHSLGVDIKGQGGFVMLAPSLHESGRHYAWLDGQSPEDIEPIMAPDWLLEAVAALVAANGGNSGAHGKSNGQAPQGAYDAFGHQSDGREDKMYRMVWRCVVQWHRQCPIKPPDGENARKARDEYEVYERGVTIQQPHPADLTKTQQLDREGRGWAVWWDKWQRAMRLWNGKVAEEAIKPDPNPDVSRETDFTDEFKAEARIDPDTGQPLPLIQTDLQFTKGFKPPDYLVDGMVQKGYLYSLTGPTGHGKTPVSMLLGSRVARGLAYHGKPVTQGGVLFLAGENSDDIRARYIAMADHEKFEIGSIPFYFIDGVIDIRAEMQRIEAEAAQIPNLSLVIVDTDQAYFLGDEGNSNEQRKWFAKTLRLLLRLPGNPAALVNCHPIKNAVEDNLVPIGGSAFLNEIDGNIVCWAEDRTCTIKPHGSKWRGVAFESMAFELRTITSDQLKDSKGRYIPSVMAFEITEEGAQRRGAVADEDEKTVLRLMHAERNASMATIARHAGWFQSDGQPAKSKVDRVMARLKKSKFIFRYHGEKYRLTKKGCKHIDVKWEGEKDDD